MWCMAWYGSPPCEHDTSFCKRDVHPPNTGCNDELLTLHFTYPQCKRIMPIALHYSYSWFFMRIFQHVLTHFFQLQSTLQCQWSNMKKCCSSYCCLAGNEGMIHFITRKNHPSNPQQPIHSLRLAPVSHGPLVTPSSLAAMPSHWPLQRRPGFLGLRPHTWPWPRWRRKTNRKNILIRENPEIWFILDML